MKKPNSQFSNTIFILIGGVLLLYEIVREDDNVYVMVLGLVLLMYGLYNATNFWVETKDDHKKEQEEESGDKTPKL